MLLPIVKECNYMIDTQRLLKKFNYKILTDKIILTAKQFNNWIFHFDVLCMMSA